MANAFPQLVGVKNHLHSIFDKLGVSDPLELTVYAVHHRMVDKP